MVSKTLSFNCALVTGGGGGIGKAISAYLTSIGKKVIIVGRTESKLAQAAKELGHGTVYYVLDTGSISTMPSFIQTLIAEHPDVDCLVNNAGVQRPFDINAGLDLQKADQEIDINIRGPMHLTIGLLDHFKTKPAATIINVSSILAFIPFSVINPVYSGTKAWLHFWSMNLRTQLSRDERGRHIMVVEIAPPTVATDLHREREDPDDNKKENNPDALSVEEFVEIVANGFEEDRECIGAGSSVRIVEKWYEAFGETYDERTAKYSHE